MRWKCTEVVKELEESVSSPGRVGCSESRFRVILCVKAGDGAALLRAVTEGHMLNACPETTEITS